MRSIESGDAAPGTDPLDLSPTEFEAEIGRSPVRDSDEQGPGLARSRHRSLRASCASFISRRLLGTAVAVAGLLL